VAVQTSQLGTLPSRRLGLLIAPREHGAWGLLLVPLAAGGAVGLLDGGTWLPLLLFTVAAVALFWLRTPAESWLGRGLLRVQTNEERQAVGITILLVAAVAISTLSLLLWNGDHSKLLLLGMVAIATFVAQGILRKIGRRTRMLSQIVGIAGLTVTAPAAYYLVTGRLDREAWALWIANFLFAGNQVHYVQLRIRSARLVSWSDKVERGRSFLIGQALLVTALFAAWRLQYVPLLAACAFLPLLIRGAIWFFQRPQPLLIRRLGWTELAYAIVFAMCLIAGFHQLH